MSKIRCFISILFMTLICLFQPVYAEVLPAGESIIVSPVIDDMNGDIGPASENTFETYAIKNRHLEVSVSFVASVNLLPAFDYGDDKHIGGEVPGAGSLEFEHTEYG